MSTASPLIAAMGESATLYRRVLNARDAVTRWPAVTWVAGGDFFCDDFDCDDFVCSPCIKIFVDEVQTREVDTPSGRVTEKVCQGYVGGSVTVGHMDRVTVQGVTYEVRSVPTVEHLLGSASFKKLELVMVTE